MSNQVPPMENRSPKVKLILFDKFPHVLCSQVEGGSWRRDFDRESLVIEGVYSGFMG
jgi:hypothetical protein